MKARHGRRTLRRVEILLPFLDTRPRPVAPGFWLGGRDARHNPPARGWNVIVNCTAERYPADGGVTLIECAIADGERWDRDELARTFDELCRARGGGEGETLIHCTAGVSRSVTMATYLLTRLGVFDNPAEALSACRYSPLPWLGPRRRTYQSALAALTAHLEPELLRR